MHLSGVTLWGANNVPIPQANKKSSGRNGLTLLELLSNQVPEILPPQTLEAIACQRPHWSRCREEPAKCSPPNGMSLSHCSSHGLGSTAEDGAQGWLEAEAADDSKDTAGQAHIWTHSSCSSTCKLCTNSSRQIPGWRGCGGHASLKRQSVACRRGETALFKSMALLYVDCALVGNHMYPRVYGQHKLDLMSF